MTEYYKLINNIPTINVNVHSIRSVLHIYDGNSLIKKKCIQNVMYRYNALNYICQ